MPKALETQKSVALLAGVVCYFFAFMVLVQLPSLLTDADEPKVVGVDGVARDVHERTDAQNAGREVYKVQVCWHCHSDFVRPVNDEDLRFGPVSQTGEYAFDLPHLFGTRRIGPDLHREGGMRIADWHLAHFYNPRYTVPHSVMPSFGKWFFYEQNGAAAGREVLSLMDVNGDGIFSQKIGDAIDDEEAFLRALTARGLLPPAAAGETDAQKQAREAANRQAVASYKNPTAFDKWGLRPPKKDGDPLTFIEAKETGDGLLTDYDLRPLPTTSTEQLVDFIDHQGTTIGRWRKPLYVTAPARVSPFSGAEEHPRKTAAMRLYGWRKEDPAAQKTSAEAVATYEKALAAWDAKYPALAGRLAHGRELFVKNCAGCHGDEGRGNGNAAPFLLIRPRDFTLGQYRYRSVPVGSLPLDGDIYRSIFRGLPGSAMQSWRELSDEQIWLLVDYVKSLYEGTKVFNDRSQAPPLPPQRFDKNPAKELARGRAVYLSSQGQCYNCHGKQGRADGPAWNDTGSDYGNFLRPRDFRPRIEEAWAPELWTLLRRSCEKFFLDGDPKAGPEAWKKASALPEWVALEPKGTEKTKAFVLFLLGEGPRLLDVLGGEDVVKEAFGEERYAILFDGVHDALDEIRMAVATEKDQPALRFRGGAAPEDILRTIFNGIDGTQMKGTFDAFWKKVPVELAGRDDIRKGERTAWGVAPPIEYKLSYVSGEAALHAVGVYDRKNAKGELEEYIKLQPGDDWALAHYIMWLACIPVPRTGE